MSRSIHHTFQHYRNREIYDFADDELKDAGLNDIWKSLEQKRAIKRQTKAGRKEAPQPTLSPDNIPLQITVNDQSEYVHFPLTEPDVREVLKLLPAGISDGLSTIVFCLGTAYMKEYEPDDTDLPTDPFTGRISHEDIPGLFLPPVLGSYNFVANRISLYAYVFDRDTLKTPVFESYLKLKMLRILLHELSHHDDQMRRTARGRWLGCRWTKAEDYAYTNQQKLVSEVITAFILEKYKTAMSELSSWIEEHGGCKVPLDELIKGGVIFTVSEAVEGLFTNVANEEPSAKTKYHFANELHYARRYDEALYILNNLLREDPGNTEAKLLVADIHCHLNEYDQAEAIVDTVIKEDPENKEALYILCDVFFDGERWQELIDLIDKLQALSGRVEGLYLVPYLEKQLFAYLHLGELEKAKAVWLAYPDNLSRHAKRKLALESLLLLVDGHYHQAIELTKGLLLKKDRLSLLDRAIAKFVFNTAAVKLKKEQMVRRMGKNEKLILENRKILKLGLG